MARAVCARTRCGEKVGAGAAQRLHALREPLRDSLRQQGRRLRRIECAFHLVDELIGARVGKEHHEAGIGAELPAAHQAARREVGGNLAAALGERAGQNDDGVDARHLEIDWLSYRIGGVLQRHPGRTAAGERAGPHAGV